MLGSEQGFTLIEMMVAMVTGVIVIGGLLMILEFSLTSQARISDRVQADRVGRVAMSKIVDELHSSCTGFGGTAIQAPSTTPTAPLEKSGPLNLWFLSTYGTASSGNAVPSSVVQHEVKWTSTGTSNTGESLGTLTDYAFTSTGGSSPNWKFPTLTVANASAKVLAKNVIPPTVSGASAIFQYYKFASGQPSAIAAAQVPAAAAANEIVKVGITFTQAPEGADTRANRAVPFSDAVLLRFNPTELGAEASNPPCA
jgi:Tfp pilus assembly protein PilW